MNFSYRLNFSLLLLMIGIGVASAISAFLPIEFIKQADCTLGYECGLYRQSLIISAEYGIPVNQLHRMSFALMLLIYYTTLIVFSKQLIKGFALNSK